MPLRNKDWWVGIDTILTTFPSVYYQTYRCHLNHRFLCLPRLTDPILTTFPTVYYQTYRCHLNHLFFCLPRLADTILTTFPSVYYQTYRHHPNHCSLYQDLQTPS